VTNETGDGSPAQAINSAAPLTGTPPPESLQLGVLSASRHQLLMRADLDELRAVEGRR
jgi:hypothetical protein